MTHIPKRLGHIWIGPKPAPTEWMRTWRDMHPEWDYTLYDNRFLASQNFRTRVQIDEYMRRGQYAGAADLIRYEILFERGDQIAAADSICVHPTDELFDDDVDLYTVYENEFVRGKLVSPILASAPQHPFLDALIAELSEIPPECLDAPREQTGNLFVATMIERLKPQITIWPSYYFNPEHFTGVRYDAEGKIYTHQKFGTTTRAYARPGLRDRLAEKLRRRYLRKRMAELASNLQRHGVDRYPLRW